jgi:hypothetical protein
MKKLMLAILLLICTSGYSQIDSNGKGNIKSDTTYERLSFGIGVLSSLGIGENRFGIIAGIDLTLHIKGNFYLGLKADIFSRFKEFHKSHGILSLQPQIEIKINNSDRFLPGLGLYFIIDKEIPLIKISPSIKYEHTFENNITTTTELRIPMSSNVSTVILTFGITYRPVSKF